MTTLPNFTAVNQNTLITEDGLPNRDAQFECVSASVLMACMQQLGITQVGGKFTPDYFKDQATSEAYMGGTSASEYVALCASLGVRLWHFDGIPGVLVSEAHKQLQAGLPVIFTEPDPYVSASLGWSHVCIFYAEEPGSLTALDPYIGKPVRRTDSEWQNLLLYNQLWIAEKMEEELPKLIELTDPEISRYYGLATADGNAWVCRQTGKVVQGGILAFYRKFGGDAFCGLTYLGLPKSNEIPLSQGAKKQYFERGVVCYDPTTPHAIDNPPGAASIYLLQLFDDGPGTDPRVASLAPLQAQVTQLQAQLKVAGNSADTQKLAQIKAIVG